MEKLVIGLAGLGTVGSGLVHMLQQNRDDILRRTGREIVLKSVAVRDLTKPRDLPPGVTLVDDPLLVSSDPEIQVFIELMGGTTTAKTTILDALHHGKSVVTANKALLAEDGNEIFALAAEKGLSLAYEASVAGAIPIIQAIKESLAGNRMYSLTGILNGTGNYILSGMSSKGLSFDEVLADAQARGYAEADPGLDVDGYDTAHKLALLIRLAWGYDYPFKDLAIEGIRGINRMDIEFAREFGYRIKLIGQAREVNGQIEAGVYPALVHHTLLLARVGGAYNAVRLEGNAAGALFFHGLGAGSKPTASAVLSDILSLARSNGSSNTGFADDNLPKASILPADEALSPWYVRVMVQDSSGVLRDIAGSLAGENVSIAQVIQKAEQPDGVPLVFMTHETTGKSMQAALRRLEQSGMALAPPLAYRVVSKNNMPEEVAGE